MTYTNSNDWIYPSSIQCQLFTTNTIHNCCGFLNDESSAWIYPHLFQDLQIQSSRLKFGLFECLRLSSDNDFSTKTSMENSNKYPNSIVLQVYFSTQNKTNLLLYLNEHFAELNGFKKGERLLLLHIENYSRCKNIELFPLTSEDWAFIAQAPFEIENNFLTQIRLIRSGMHFVIFRNATTSSMFKFILKIPGSTNNQSFLVDMDTRVVILPMNYGKIPKGTENVKNSRPKCHEANADFALASCLRVLPQDSVYFANFPSSERHESFFTQKNEFLSLINVLPFLFVLEEKKTAAPLTFGISSLNTHFVEIYVPGRRWYGALLLLKVPTNLDSVLTTFLREITTALEKTKFSGLPQCWMSPGTKANVPDVSDLTWIRVRKIPHEQLQRTNQLIALGVSNALKFKKSLNLLFAASRRLQLPWLIPTQGLFLQIEQDKGVIKPRTIQAEEQSGSFFFCPFSQQLDVRVHQHLSSQNVDEQKQTGRLNVVNNEDYRGKLMKIPYQEELVSLLQEHLYSTFRHSIIDRKWPLTFNTYTLLIGPMGSGKTTILNKLAQRIRNSNTRGLIINSEVVDCSLESPADFVKHLRVILTRLNEHWPSVLFLDNFDKFAEKTATTDERISILRKKKIFKSIFSMISKSNGAQIICAMSNQQLFHGTMHHNKQLQQFKVNELSKREQLDLIGNLSGHISLSELYSKKLGFDTIGNVIKTVERLRSTQMPVKIVHEAVKFSQNNENDEISHPIKFNQIVGLAKAKQKLTEVFLWPSKYPKLFSNSGLQISKRAILHGPSGCGKSLLMRALASEMDVNVVHVRGPEVFSKYIGQSELKMRQLFTKAKNNLPSLIIFEEFDALVPRRGSDNTHVTDRLVNLFLTELDGFEEETRDLFICCATNRLDLIDKALLRPGRIEHQIYVGNPDMAERTSILRFYTDGCGIPLSDNVNLKLISEQTEGFSAAEMRAIVQNVISEAERCRESTKHGLRIRQKHFQAAIKPMTDKMEYRRNQSYSSMLGRKLTFS